MFARCVRQTREASAVETNAIDVGAEDDALGAGEVNPLIVVIDAVQNAGFPWTVRDLLLERSVSSILIEMFEAAAVAEPQERAILEKCQFLVVIGFDPRLCRFPEQRLCSAAVEFDSVQVE